MHIFIGKYKALKLSFELMFLKILKELYDSILFFKICVF